GELHRVAPTGGRRAGTARAARASSAATGRRGGAWRPGGEVDRRRADDHLRLFRGCGPVRGGDAADDARAGGGGAARGWGGAARGRGAAGRRRLRGRFGGGGAAALRPGGGGPDPVQRPGGRAAQWPAGVSVRGAWAARAEGVRCAGDGV